MTLSLAEVPSEDRGKPIYCWFRFEGDDTHRFIQIDVKDIRAGDYDDYTRNCHEGYLRISDEDVCSSNPDWLPPTTLCGHYEQGTVRVKRITRTPSAFVEFRLEKGRPTKGYEFDVTFVDTDSEAEGAEDVEELPYGHLQRQDGRVPDTRYPGIYAPNIRCQYLFTNFDDQRVSLQLGGRFFSGKFDMKRSENCSEDYVEVYDGMSAINPLIGRFCGHNGKHVISRGSSLLLIFQSGPGGPPWDYSGFDIQVTDRWRDHHFGGQKVAGSVCDWLFESADSMSGDLHTPDIFLEPGSHCIYRFQGESHERVELNLAIELLKRNCAEKLEIFDGDILLDIICRENITRRSQEFIYNTTGAQAEIRFTSSDGQMSNPRPTWIEYKFLSDPLLTNSAISDKIRHYAIGLDTSIDDEVQQPPANHMETQQDAPPGGNSGHYIQPSSALTAAFLLLLLPSSSFRHLLAV